MIIRGTIMTNEQKWELHTIAEQFNQKCSSTTISNSMSIEQYEIFNKLCDKYRITRDVLLKSYNMYGSVLLKLALRAPSMSDSEAEFIKYLFDNHMYIIQSRSRAVHMKTR